VPEPSAERRATPVPQVETARVLAMAAIFLFHLWSVVPEGAGTGWASVALSQGHLGVVVFNVITGLVLAWPHLGPGRRPIPELGAFLRRRFLRIVPAYWLALGLWAGVAALVDEPPAARSVVTHLLFVHTLSPAEFFTIVPAYWWLGLLAELYLAFPLVLRFQQAVGPWRGAAVVCAACWGGWLVADALARPGSTAALLNYMGYFNLPYRLPEFALGIGLASSLRTGAGGGPPRLAAGACAALLAASALLMAIPAALPGSAPLVHVRLVAGCVALFVALLALPMQRAEGRIARLAAASYSFYLLHQPILGYGLTLLRRVGPHVAFWLLLVGAGVLTFRLARRLDHVVSALAARGVVEGDSSRA
jgi:peptidoglycan/LPS O-acetylase OafA/YrhL